MKTNHTIRALAFGHPAVKNFLEPALV